MTTYSVYARRIDQPHQRPDLVRGVATMDEVVSYLTMVYEVKGGHSLWVLDGKGGHEVAPWFAVMQYDIFPDKCYVCGGDNYDNPWGEACDGCMAGDPDPGPVGSYFDGYGNDYGWQDSTFPNEY